MTRTKIKYYDRFELENTPHTKEIKGKNVDVKQTKIPLIGFEPANQSTLSLHTGKSYFNHVYVNLPTPKY